ncbi:MAG: hypothetical protein KIC61_07220 [Staphylococcus sp.]|jgi:hypothetical protein|nr:hypothetical protein [Staphylococcus sp.]
MYLKKKFIQIPFSNKKSFSIIYSGENDLKNGVIKLCNYLKKETFLVQVFSQDRLNEILSIYDNNYLNYKNFNYYKIDNLKFLNNLSFEELRFLNIYSLNQNSRLDINRLKDAQDNYTFQLGFDNYLEYVELIINYDYYDEELVKKFLELE